MLGDMEDWNKKKTGKTNIHTISISFHSARTIAEGKAVQCAFQQQLEIT